MQHVLFVLPIDTDKSIIFPNREYNLDGRCVNISFGVSRA